MGDVCKPEALAFHSVLQHLEADQEGGAEGGTGLDLRRVCMFEDSYKNLKTAHMLGMGTVVGANNKIVPGKVYIGSNAKGLKENTIGLERNNVTPEILESEIARFEKLYEDMHT